MKTNRIFALGMAVLMVLTFAVSLFGCSDSDKIEVVKLPDKTVFFVGERIDVSGAQIKVTDGGEEKLVDVTEDMVVFTADISEDGKYENVVFPAKPMETSGVKTVNLSYANTYFTFEIFVDDNVSNYKIYCNARLDSYLEDEHCDSVVEHYVEKTKGELSGAEKFSEATEIMDAACAFIDTYLGLRDGQLERDEKYAELKAELDSVNSLNFSLDQREQLSGKTAELEEKMAQAKTAQELDELYADFQAELQKFSSDPANDFIKALEARFDREYGSRKVYYSGEDYNALVSALITYEKLIRLETEASEMTALENDLFDEILKKRPSYATAFYSECESLLDVGIVFSTDEEKIAALNTEIIEFIEKIEKVKIKDVNSDGDIDVRDIAASEEYKALASTKELASCSAGNTLEKAQALFDEYARLGNAKKEAASVISSISAIGKVKLGSNDEIIAARRAYDAWSKKHSIDPTNKNNEMVSNYDSLVAAETRWSVLPAEAKSEASAVRTAINAIEYDDMIYSLNPRYDTSNLVTSAEKKYNDWIEKFGDLFADQYIGAEYKAKISLYKQQYNTLKTKAESLMDDIEYLFDMMDDIKYETFEADCLEIEDEYYNIQDSYKKFKEENGGHADVITNYDRIESTFEKKKYDAYLEFYIGFLESTVNNYISGMNTLSKFNTYRTQLRSLLSTAISSLEDIYDPDESFDKNKTEMLLEYNTHNDAISEVYQDYKSALAVHNAGY